MGGVSSTALSINKAGQVVGFADTVAAGVHAFVWEDAQGMTDLNNLIPACSGWTLMWATAINEGGQIVGRGYHNGNERAFLLTPAPVKLIGLEVTQVVQDWQNSVPLAAGFIFSIHFFNTHFRIEKFPMDTVIFSGRISKKIFPTAKDRRRKISVRYPGLSELGGRLGHH